MSLVDPLSNYNLATLLVVGGHSDNGLGYTSGELVGKATFEGIDFSILPHWSFTTDDLLYGARPFYQRRNNFRLELPELEDPRRYDSLTIGGPRRFWQPGQSEETWHDLYLHWRPQEDLPVTPVDQGLKCQVDIGLDEPWTSGMGRTAKGIMVSQVVSQGKLLTRLTVVRYSVKSTPHETMYLKPQHACFEGAFLPEKLVAGLDSCHMAATAKEALVLFGKHCEPTNIGNSPPYWDTLFKDLTEECQRATRHQHSLSASHWIQTPWDIIAYCQAWGANLGVRERREQSERVQDVLAKLWNRLPTHRQAQLDALLPLAQQHFQWKARK